MSSTEGRAAAFRNTIEHFLKERLDAKLDKLQADDPKRADLIAQHRRETWLADAARRVTQIQIVTHTLKPIHPDARGTNLFCAPHDLPAHTEVGSHVHSLVKGLLGGKAGLPHELVGRKARPLLDGIADKRYPVDGVCCVQHSAGRR